MVWALIATIGGIVLAAYGWKMSKDLVAGEPKGDATVESRSKYSLYMLIGAVVVAIILLLAFWAIYKAVPVTP